MLRGAATRVFCVIARSPLRAMAEHQELHASDEQRTGRQEPLGNPAHGIRQQHTPHHGVPEKKRVRWSPKNLSARTEWRVFSSTLSTVVP